MVARKVVVSPSKKSLSFNEKLSGNTTDALLKKLKALHTELAEMDQDLVDTNSLNVVRKALVSTSIQHHKDQGVKAYAACCLADILRLYAPDAPYTQAELRDIFQFFFHQLSSGLRSSESTYFNEYFHLLESLSTVKSVVLVCDLPNPDELMLHIFRAFFTLVKRDLSRKIELFMADILIALIDESQAVPSAVLSMLLSQFADKTMKVDDSTHRMVIAVCNATADKLQRHVCQYFTDIVVSESEGEDFEAVKEAHELVLALSRSCPGLLHSVIPQLEEELRVEDTQLRPLATQVLGEIYSNKGGLNFVRKYPSTWAVWQQRKNDKMPQIRVNVVEACSGLLVNLPQHRDVIQSILATKLMDPDEKVRAAVCRVYSHMSYEQVLHIVEVSQLKDLARRGLDKKNHVRVEAITSIARLFGLAYLEIDKGDPAAIQHFGWIPQEILHMSAVNAEVKLITEQVFGDYILPFPSLNSPSTSQSADIDDRAWTGRLLCVMRFLDEKAINSLLGLSGIKTPRPTLIDKYIQSCIENNGGVIDDNDAIIKRRLSEIIRRVAASLSDPHKATEDLNAFACLNENRLYKLFKTATDGQTDLKSLVKATHEFLRRVEQESPSILPTMTALIRRASLRFINQSSIPWLLAQLQKSGIEEDETVAAKMHAKTILCSIAKHNPIIFKIHVPELLKSIASADNEFLVEIALQALALTAKQDRSIVPTDKRALSRITKLALSSNARHSKFAAILLASAEENSASCAQLIKTIVHDLESSKDDELLARVAALAQLATSATKLFDNNGSVIIEHLLKKVVLKPILANPEAMVDEQEWFEDHQVPTSLKTRLMALKVCRNRCMAHVGGELEGEVAAPLLKLTMSILLNHGSVTANDDDDPRVRSRMRLQAATTLLRLSTVKSFDATLSSHFLTLALVAQDPCFEVRNGFLTKLINLLTPNKLPPRFNVIPFLTIHDPEPELTDRATAYVSYASRTLNSTRKLENLEAIFLRFLHLLAHHPDFGHSLEKMEDIAKYIEYYIRLMVNQENLSLIYYYASITKQLRDVESDVYTENFYATGEMAQELLKGWAHNHSWNLQSYPGKVKIPRDVVQPLSRTDGPQDIAKRIYLTQEVVDWLAEKNKVKGQPFSKEKRSAPLKQSNTKRKTVARVDRPTKRARAAAYNDDDSDTESSVHSATEGSADALPSPPPTSDEEQPPTGRDEKLARGARTRAKAKIRKQVRH